MTDSGDEDPIRAAQAACRKAGAQAADAHLITRACVMQARAHGWTALDRAAYAGVVRDNVLADCTHLRAEETLLRIWRGRWAREERT